MNERSESASSPGDIVRLETGAAASLRASAEPVGFVAPSERGLLAPNPPWATLDVIRSVNTPSTFRAGYRVDNPCFSEVLQGLSGIRSG